MSAAIAIAIAAGLGGPPEANARRGLPRAAACPPITMRLFDSSGKRVPTRVRIKRHHVTCAQARRLIATYLRRVTSRVCASHGTRCILAIGGGWTCSFVSVGESEATGGAIMGCFRSPTTRLTIVPVAKVTQRDFSVATAPGVSCEMTAATLFCQNAGQDHGDTATLAPEGRCTRVTRRASVAIWATPVWGRRPTGPGTASRSGPTAARSSPPACGCIVTPSGKGFEMTAQAVSAIGGATPA